MERMKTFFIYFLIVIGFFIVSCLIEILAFHAMYGSIIDNGSIENGQGIVLEIAKIKATNVNGFIELNAVNKNNSDIKNKYIKVDLINKQDLIAATKYIKIADLKSEESVKYKVTFKANNIEGYKISVTDDAPDINENIINIFGVEVDVDNLVMSAKNGYSMLPDFVFALASLYITLKTGRLLWLIYVLI